MADLKSWLNKAYLGLDVIRAIKKAFLSHPILPNIQLKKFLKPSEFNKLKKQMLKLDYKHNYQPDNHSYYSADTPEAFLSLIQSKQFKNLIEQYTGVKIKGVACEAQYFKAGNYTLLQDKQTVKNGIAFYFDFSNLKQGYTVFFNKDYDNLTQFPFPNALVLAKQAPSYRHFIKYIDHKEKYKRYLIKGVFITK